MLTLKLHRPQQVLQTVFLCNASDTHTDKGGVSSESVHGMCGTSYTLKKTSSLHGKGPEDDSVTLSSVSVKKLLWDLTRGQQPLLAYTSQNMQDVLKN